MRMSGIGEALYWRKLSGGKVRCELCFRMCIIPLGRRGFCQVRENREEKLYTLVYGLPCTVYPDPIEGEPLHHFLPGRKALCLATVGCSLRCLFCHNWQISQAPPERSRSERLSPSEVVRMAERAKCPAISFTFTEPTVFYEYMLDICKWAKKARIRTIMHTCGIINQRPLQRLLPLLDAVVVDLKSFGDKRFQKAAPGWNTSHVLEVIKVVKRAGKWLEIVNLMIPGHNDNFSLIRKMCCWIREEVGPYVPLHFTRFSPAHKMRHVPPTPVDTLERARRIALEEGLKFVYIGNVPGHPANNTYCPKCGRVVILRLHWTVIAFHLQKGRCKFCGFEVPGVWA